MSKPWTCHECGGTVREVADHGRTFLVRYRGELAHRPIPADYLIDTCDGCGESWLDDKQVDYLARLLGDGE